MVAERPAAEPPGGQPGASVSPDDAPPDWSASFHRAPPGVGSEKRPTEAHISADLLQELIDWAREGYPNEAGGIVSADRSAAERGRPAAYHRLTNADASPWRYRIDPQEQFDAMLRIDDAGEVVWGVFHSHVASPAEPSETDIGLAFYPDSLYLICSLAGPDVPVVRAWSIIEGRPEEVSLRVG